MPIAAPHAPTRHDTALHDTALHDTALHDTVRQDTVPHGATPSGDVPGPLSVDRQLMATGNLPAEEWVRQHLGALYRYAYRLTGNPHDAEDLTQTTFLLAQQRSMQLDHPERIQNWLFAILRNAFIDQWRRKRPELTDNFDQPAFCAPVPPTADIDEEQLQQAIGELPCEFRVVVLMYYFEALSYREIAQALAIPLGTVMSRLSRAKSHLRQRMSDPVRDPNPAESAWPDGRLARRQEQSS